jgi:hypothetical protein
MGRGAQHEGHAYDFCFHQGVPNDPDCAAIQIEIMSGDWSGEGTFFRGGDVIRHYLLQRLPRLYVRQATLM